MITKFFTLFASLTTGVALLFSQGPKPYLERVKGLMNDILPESTPAVLEEASGQLVRDWLIRKDSAGDPYVRQGLILAAVSATGLSPVEVLENLDEGQSIEEIVELNAATVDDVLAVYDQTVEYLFGKAMDNERLPESLAQSRIEWYQDVGRLMIDQPGLKPAFPGLHQLHVAIIAAAAKVGEINRWEMQAGLHDCQTLDEILAENGHTGQEAVDLTMGHLNDLLDRGVESGALSSDQAREWSEFLQEALEKMVVTPGLHVAGIQCAQ